MTMSVRTNRPPVARRVPAVYAQTTVPESVLATLMFGLVFAGLAAFVLAGQVFQVSRVSSVRTDPERSGLTRPVEGAPPSVAAEPAPALADVPSVAAAASTPVEAAPAPQPSEAAAAPVEAVPTLAVDGRARVANTDGLGVVLYTAPRTGARIPAGLLEGTPVTVLEVAEGEWARVRSERGQVGWVPTAYLAAGD